jgi:hypothetical protein
MRFFKAGTTALVPWGPFRQRTKRGEGRREPERGERWRQRESERGRRESEQEGR